jgi:hypothetical protein
MGSRSDIPNPGWLVCPTCSYDLRGLPENRCPECGTPFNPAELKFHYEHPEYAEKGPRLVWLLIMHLLISGSWLASELWSICTGRSGPVCCCIGMPVTVALAIISGVRLPMLLVTERKYISEPFYRFTVMFWALGCLLYCLAAIGLIRRM